MQHEKVNSLRKTQLTLPKARGLPLVGALPELIWKKQKFWHSYRETYGDIFQLNLGVNRLVIVGHPDYAQHILQTNARNYSEKGGNTGFRAAILALTRGGTPTVDGDDASWKRQRRIVQPFFHWNSIHDMTDVMVDLIETEITQGYIAQTTSADNHQVKVDLLPEMTRVVMSSFIKTIYGTYITPEEVDKLTQSTRSVFDYIWFGMIAAACPDWVPIPGLKKQQKEFETIEKIVFGLIERHRQSSNESSDLITVLLEAMEAEGNQQITQEQLRDETISILLGGYEPMTTATSLALYLLAQHPKKLQLVQNEIDTVLGLRRPNFTDLRSLSYTRMVLQEALRIYPPSYWLQRQAKEDDIIDGFRVPAGSLVLTMINLCHYHPKIWRNPEQFEPERFLPEQMATRPKLSWMPFGSGKRMCIAEEFAMVQGTLILVQMLQRYTMDSVEGYTPELKMVTNLRPKEKVWVKVGRRNTN